jgi:hypothetical protein
MDIKTKDRLISNFCTEIGNISMQTNSIPVICIYINEKPETFFTSDSALNLDQKIELLQITLKGLEEYRTNGIK